MTISLIRRDGRLIGKDQQSERLLGHIMGWELHKPGVLDHWVNIELIEFFAAAHSWDMKIEESTSQSK